ncbi:MAG: hypothetical protein ACR2MO_08530 [Acidimicrobiales bacterium]
MKGRLGAQGARSNMANVVQSTDDPVAGITARLGAAQHAVVDHHEAGRLARQLRDGLVVEAIDLHGMSHRRVAKAVGLSPSSIEGILAAG